MGIKLNMIIIILGTRDGAIVITASLGQNAYHKITQSLCLQSRALHNDLPSLVLILRYDAQDVFAPL